ncbi:MULTISPECIES: HAD family hydrolase [Streptomyces]|uniref:HAD family hydrolase n=1 Tax=Streptomyces lienomycini TaxID=284035 RepID=A0ABV9WWE7_9ACTN|nr:MULTISPECIES: HAD-IA family hydrolase [Streptomyces]
MTDTGLGRAAIDDPAALLRTFGSVRAVLFDFDGPVCDLFGGRATADVARQVKRTARRHWGPLDAAVEECDDSHGILRPLREMYERSVPRPSALPLELAEAAVTDMERHAVRTAAPTPHLHALVELLLGLGKRLVVVSNNAEGPIREYLARLGLGPKFDGVFGRSPHDARLMKPHPDCVHRALRHLALPAADCLLVGDQLTDLGAARSAGTGFLGFTRHAVRALEMAEGGADAVVASYLPVVRAADGPPARVAAP